MILYRCPGGLNSYDGLMPLVDMITECAVEHPECTSEVFTLLVQFGGQIPGEQVYGNDFYVFHVPAEIYTQPGLVVVNEDDAWIFSPVELGDGMEKFRCPSE